MPGDAQEAEEENMKKGLLVLGVIIGVIVILVGFFAGGYNSLVTKQTNVMQKAADIDTQLQRRADLIPNLVNTVKAFSDHETEVFSEVTKAREHLMAAGSMAEKSEADQEVTSALNKLIAIAESYPELKSDTVYVDLMDEIAGTENRISYARQEYNATVTEYNMAIRTFPGVFFANMFGFEKAELFESKEGADEVPEVQF